MTEKTYIVVGLQPRRGPRTVTHREERRVSTPYLAWAAAIGAAGCGRCAAAA